MYHTLVFHSIKLGKNIQKALSRKNFLHSLSVTQASAIMLIGQYGCTSQIFVANHLHLEPGSVVTLIDNLEKLKLVKRGPCKDRRRYDLCLTEKGSRVAKTVTGRVKTLDSFIRASLTVKEAATLEKITAKLTNALNNWGSYSPKPIAKRQKPAPIQIRKGGEHALSSPKRTLEIRKDHEKTAQANVSI